MSGVETELDELTPRQETFLQDFIARYNERTKKSKEWTVRYRSLISDWIFTLNYHHLLKELQYPLVASRSAGSKMWDIDGNEYVDILQGYGVSALGHNPQFINEAIERQLRQGMILGPNIELTGELAELMCELTGLDRVAFSNTGTEAVMTAMRLARAYTGRNKIVIFNGSYHGHFDGVLGGSSEKLKGVDPVIPSMQEDVLILKDSSEESLEIIRSRGHELAAVLIAPVHSGNLNLTSEYLREYLHKLRQITKETGTVLIFDEVLTGFRLHPKGAQGYFDTDADVVTYGKAIGGGMPISAIVGKSRFMDRIDGGMWDYGDDSHPTSRRIFFAGTYCKHPLAIVSAYETLKYYKEQGPALQEQVTRRTSEFVQKLNTYLDEKNMAARFAHFGPFFGFRTNLPKDPIEKNILFYLIREKGVYTWEGNTCMLCAAHTDEDTDIIVNAFKDSIEELHSGGFPFSSL
ncbi:MAG: aminotransferase class III-fold pyridoxal phosphate-dependent enzyme [Desulfobacterales bacterium]|nr:aminotransferase class III-fold pyridoxal phosphate-dependent enzyme [Desulfobacterales bacterium]